VGAWWRRYRVLEHDAKQVLGELPAGVPGRLLRPNLSWRFLRVESPFSAHVTVVTLAGRDLEGFCYSVRSACRSTRPESWAKATLEAVQGRHHVRHLLRTPLARSLAQGPPTDFAGHALYFSVHPERLRETPFENVPLSTEEHGDAEDLAALQRRLG